MTMKNKQGFLSVRILLFLLFLVLFGFKSFSQEEEKPTQHQQKVADEAQKIKDNTDWSNPEETRKAMIKLGKLMQELDKEAGIATNEFPLDTTLQAPIVIGAEMAEQLTNEILRDFEMAEVVGEISDEHYIETTFLVIDMEKPKPGFTLADLKNYQNVQVLFISGTKTGVEIDLNSLFMQLADKPITELYLVRNYAGTRIIPESIGTLTNLKKLALYGNQISSLPGSIQNLAGLEELYVDLNPIERFPDDIARLKNLRMLGIAKTGISESERSHIQKLVPNCKILTK
jgi:Leucine-rich repeat (LRR) protein